ncbi:MAG: PilZ domain-containing protein [Planctomycetes bacterium]|nr:PilZ domain-containing protein [Planctomycetota bacterium]
MDSMERRRELRFRVNDCMLKCSRDSLLSFLKKPDNHTLPVVNLSMGGVEFLCKEHIHRGKKVTLHIDVPAFDEVLDFKGEVRWTRDVPDKDMYRLGVKFKNVSQDNHKKLILLKKDGLMRKLSRERESLL